MRSSYKGPKKRVESQNKKQGFPTEKATLEPPLRAHATNTLTHGLVPMESTSKVAEARPREPSRPRIAAVFILRQPKPGNDDNQRTNLACSLAERHSHWKEGTQYMVAEARFCVREVGGQRNFRLTIISLYAHTHMIKNPQRQKRWVTKQQKKVTGGPNASSRKKAPKATHPVGVQATRNPPLPGGGGLHSAMGTR